MMVVLTSCSNFDREFTVRSANSTVEIYTDGTAFVSEFFDIAVKQSVNYGGVYVDIPQRFTDASGGVHWRDFELAAARRDGRDEYYSRENNVPGYAIYIGEEHCKDCSANLPTGLTKIQIAYWLGRLVRQEGDREVLFLPAYMGRVHGQAAKKTLTLKLPPGGTIRPSQQDREAAYDIMRSAPNEILVSIPAGKGDRALPDIEIEYPAGTFVTITSGKRVEWWLSDHFLPFISILGPLIAGLFVLFRWQGWRSPASLIAVDIKMTKNISPALAAYLFRNWKKDAAKAAFMASVCQLAVKRMLRISSLDEDAEASSLFPKQERKKGKPGRSRWYALPAATRLVFGHIEGQRPAGDRRRVVLARRASRDELHKAVAGEYLKFRGKDRWSSVAIFSILVMGIVLAWFSGLLLLSTAICGILLLSLIAVMAFLHPERLSGQTDARQAFTFFVTFPGLAIVALVYIGTTEVISEQWPYLMAILLHIAGIIAVLATSRRPTPKQRQMRSNMLILERYFRGEIDGPVMSVECYEHYLPFAVALDVEQRWTERFNLWRESEKMETYAPDWRSSS
ncbi:Predicted membrane protein [Rhizobium aethiopicum]|uniref:Predicted membrane protein n=2 Tax=Rhizobium aethiopicum TaxID=1138170 RepID=A0A1C3Y5L4_9HYPH|nr:Predicted membrane protein [Rhizobium aethiopicum]